MQVGHVGGDLSSPSSPTNPKSAGYPGFRQSGVKSEDLIHQFLQVGDIPQPDLPNFGVGSISPGRQYSPEFVKLLQQIAGDPRLNSKSHVLQMFSMHVFNQLLCERSHYCIYRLLSISELTHGILKHTRHAIKSYL